MSLLGAPSSIRRELKQGARQAGSHVQTCKATAQRKQCNQKRGSSKRLLRQLGRLQETVQQSHSCIGLGRSWRRRQSQYRGSRWLLNTVGVMCCGLVVRHSEVERTEEVDVARIAWVGGHQGALHKPDNRRTMVGGGKIGSTEVAKVRNPHGQAQGRQPFLCIRQRSASRLDFSVLEENAGLEPPAWNSQKSLQNCQHSGSERDGLRAEMSRGNTQYLHQRIPHTGLRAAPGIGRGIKRGIDGIGFQRICKELRDLP